jgi:glycosyltransferase involved in cell wall biosynthesis
MIADELAKGNPRIVVIHLPRNMKLGGALRSGFKRVSKDYVLYSDSDLPFDMEELKKALRILKLTQADVVTAYRHDRTSEGFIRTIYSLAYNMLIRLLFNVRIRDINFALKLFKREILDSIELTSNGSFIDAEFIICCHRKGYKIVQFGIDYFQRLRGTSTLSGTRVITNILKELLRFRFAGHASR